MQRIGIAIYVLSQCNRSVEHHVRSDSVHDAASAANCSTESQFANWSMCVQCKFLFSLSSFLFPAANVKCPSGYGEEKRGCECKTRLDGKK